MRDRNRQPETRVPAIGNDGVAGKTGVACQMESTLTVPSLENAMLHKVLVFYVFKYSLSIQHKYNELVSKLCNALKVTELTYQMRCPMSKMLTYSAKEQQGRLPKYSEKILDVL